MFRVGTSLASARFVGEFGWNLKQSTESDAALGDDACCKIAHVSTSAAKHIQFQTGVANTTDVPVRAIDEGLIGWYGTLDPSDGGNGLRASLSAQYHAPVGSGRFEASAFYIFNQLHLLNDFTQYLVDPEHGDQEDQFETRDAIGSVVNYMFPAPLGGVSNEILVGAQTRYDILQVGRLPSEGGEPLPLWETDDDPPSFSDDDRVRLFASAVYLQATTQWTAQLRSVIGVRDDYQYGTDVDLLSKIHELAGYTNGGTRSQSLPQPKGGLIYQPHDDLEFYLSAGEGFHSADLRGVNQDKSIDLGLPNTPLLARQLGEEIGTRAAVDRDIAFTLSVYNLWQQSETILDPDVGQDSAGPPSERYGFEANLTWQIRDWLEFYGSYSGNHTRFTQPFDDGTGHYGTYITDAPAATGSLALYLENLGPWAGGVDYRYLGNYPLSSGPCVNQYAEKYFWQPCGVAPTATGQVNGKGFSELDLDANYTTPTGWVASLGIYNMLDTHAAAAEFWYVDRLQSEISEYPYGRADIHEHPLEPIMFRVSISKRFG